MGEDSDLIKQQLAEIWSEQPFALLLLLKSQCALQALLSSLFTPEMETIALALLNSFLSATWLFPL